MSTNKLRRLIRSDPIYFVGVALSSAVLVGAILIVMARPVVLHGFVLPLAKAVFSPDGVIEEDTIDLVDRLLVKIGGVGLLLGFVVLCYSIIWRYFGSRLPTRGHAARIPSTLPVSRLELCFLLTAILVALALGLHSITRGLTHDEIFTAVHFVEVDSVWKTIASHYRGNNHIAFSILARLSEAMFGRHEWALRLPALLLGLGSLYCLWAVGRKLLGPRLAVAATFCLALSRVHVLYSVSARGYAGMILFTFMSSYLFFELLDRPTRRRGLMFILVTVVGIYFLLYAALVTVVQMLFLLYLAAREVLADHPGRVLGVQSFRILWLSFPVIVAVSLIGYAPAFPQLMVHVEHQGRVPFQPLFPVGVIEYLSGTAAVPLGPLVLPAVVMGLISLRSSRSREIVYWILLFIIPVGVAWLADPTVRYFVYLLPYYVLLIVSGFSTAWGFAARGHPRASSYLLRALCIVLAGFVLSAWAFNSWNSIPKEGYRDAVRTMETDATDLIGLCGIGGGAQLFQYYSDREIFVPLSMEEFQQFAEKYSEIRCAYRKRSWEPPEHTEIGEFLSRNATSQQCRNVTVFTYRR